MRSTGQGMGIGELCRVLSRPFPSDATRAAARRFQEAPTSNAYLDRTYHFLVWQRTLRTVLGHLADCGADLEALHVSSAQFRRTFPAGYKPVWDVDVDTPVSAARLIEMYAKHRSLLAEPIDDLLAGGCEGFTLLSGRAYEARYPSYAWRVEFDTDLISPDMDAAMQVVGLLEQTGYELDSVRIRRLGESPDATVEIRRRVDGHRVSIGVLVGGYHGYRAPIHQRAELVTFRGRSVRVPMPEDLLLMLAARVERKRAFALVNVNDAAVVMSSSGGNLDWDHIVSEAGRSGLGVTLAVVLNQAERILAKPMMPEGIPATLIGRQRLSHALAKRAAASDTQMNPTSVTQRAIKRMWLADVDARRARRSDTPGQWSRLALRVQRPILRRQIQKARSGGKGGVIDRAAVRLRTRCGALCEVAPHLAGDVECVQRFGSWRGTRRAAALLAGSAASIAPDRGAHRCSRLLFDLSHPQGT